MSELNKAVLQQANAAIAAGDQEGFLACCTDDIVWTTVGGETLNGKQAVRRWMADGYATPPQFSVHQLIADGDCVAAVGEILLPGAHGQPLRHAYCDVWRFRDGLMSELKAFVIGVDNG